MNLLTSQQTLVALCIFLCFSSCCHALTPVIRQRHHTGTLCHAASRNGASSDEAPPAVICVGDALYDCIANDFARGWTVEQMMQHGEQAWTAFPGGAPVNVACACRKLGTSSAFVGCLGKDADGDAFIELLQQTNVDVSLLQRTDQQPTRRVMVTRSLHGDRAFGGFANNRAAPDFADAYLDATQLLSKADALLQNNPNGILVSSTLSLAFPTSAKAVRAFVDRGLELGLRLFVDVNWRPVFWTTTEEEEARQSILSFAKQADIVKLTDEEAAWLVPDISTASDALAHPEIVHQQFPKAMAVLVTAGELGAVYSMWDGCVGRIAPMEVTVVETTGAGDAFSAGFLHRFLALDLDLDQVTGSMSQKERQRLAEAMVRFASVVGALTCTKEGAIAAQPTLQDAEEFLSSTNAA